MTSEKLTPEEEEEWTQQVIQDNPWFDERICKVNERHEELFGTFYSYRDTSLYFHKMLVSVPMLGVGIFYIAVLL